METIDTEATGGRLAPDSIVKPLKAWGRIGFVAGFVAIACLIAASIMLPFALLKYLLG